MISSASALICGSGLWVAVGAGVVSLTVAVALGSTVGSAVGSAVDSNVGSSVAVSVGVGSVGSVGVTPGRAGGKRVPFVQFGLSFTFVWRIIFYRTMPSGPQLGIVDVGLAGRSLPAR